MADVTSQMSVQAAAAAKPSARRYYVLGLLTVIYALNFLDRTIFNVLIEPIKKEFQLSDTMMGLLAGFGFALFYSVLGIPIARVADRLNRRNIVAAAFAFWSAMTALCGAMQESFVPEPLGPTLRFLASQRSFIIVLIGFCLTTYTNYATAAWIPPFLARVHHLSSAEIGTYAGTFKELAGMAGPLLGGFVVAQVSRRDDRWKLWAPAITSGLAGPVFALCMLTQDFAMMVAMLALTSFLVGFHLGPIFAIAQTVAKPSMRALASALIALTATFFGQGRRPACGRRGQRRPEGQLWH